MDYSMIGKIEKARRYAEQEQRVSFESFSVSVEGDHAVHQVSYQNQQWKCDCAYFASRGYCSHTMALERILGEMLPSKNDSGDE